MSITDKELLTFCNLANLPWHFAEYRHNSKKKGKASKGEKIKYKKIYNLLDPEMFYNGEVTETDVNGRKTKKKAYCFGDPANNKEKSLAQMRVQSGMAMEYKEKYEESKKDNNHEGAFLTEWEVIYGADNYQLASDFYNSCMAAGERMAEIKEISTEFESKNDNQLPTRDEVKKRKNAILELQRKELMLNIGKQLFVKGVTIGAKWGVKKFNMVNKNKIEKDQNLFLGGKASTHARSRFRQADQKISKLKKSQEKLNIKKNKGKLSPVDAKRLKELNSKIDAGEKELERAKKALEIHKTKGNDIPNYFDPEGKDLINMAQGNARKNHIKAVLKTAEEAFKKDDLDEMSKTIKKTIDTINKIENQGATAVIKQPDKNLLKMEFKKIVSGTPKSWGIEYLNKSLVALGDYKETEIKKEMNEKFYGKTGKVPIIDSNNANAFEIVIKKKINFYDTGFRVSIFKKGNDVVIAFVKKEHQSKMGPIEGVLPKDSEMIKIVYSKVKSEFLTNSNLNITATGYGKGALFATMLGNLDSKGRINVIGFEADYPTRIVRAMSFDTEDLNEKHKSDVELYIKATVDAISIIKQCINMFKQIKPIMDSLTVGTLYFATMGVYSAIEILLKGCRLAAQLEEDIKKNNRLLDIISLLEKKEILRLEQNNKFHYLTENFKKGYIKNRINSVVSKKIAFKGLVQAVAYNPEVQMDIKDWLYTVFISRNVNINCFYYSNRPFEIYHAIGGKASFDAHGNIIPDGEVSDGTRFILFKPDDKGIYKISSEIVYNKNQLGIECTTPAQINQNRIKANNFYDYIYELYLHQQGFIQNSKNYKYKCLTFNSKQKENIKPFISLKGTDLKDEKEIKKNLEIWAKIYDVKKEQLKNWLWKKDDNIIDVVSISEMDFFPYLTSSGILGDNLNDGYIRSVLRSIVTDIKKFEIVIIKPTEYRQDLSKVKLKRLTDKKFSDSTKDLKWSKDFNKIKLVSEIAECITNLVAKTLKEESAKYEYDWHRYKEMKFFSHYNHLFELLGITNKTEPKVIFSNLLSYVQDVDKKYIFGYLDKKDIEYKYNRNDSMIGGQLELPKELDKLKTENTVAQLGNTKVYEKFKANLG